MSWGHYFGVLMMKNVSSSFYYAHDYDETEKNVRKGVLMTAVLLISTHGHENIMVQRTRTDVGSNHN